MIGDGIRDLDNDHDNEVFLEYIVASGEHVTIGHAPALTGRQFVITRRGIIISLELFGELEAAGLTSTIADLAEYN